jgi:N-acetylglucosaminyl-diphospho-decaprenol L-rhamnosyltransferase
MSTPLSVILLNFNTRDLTLSCLASISQTAQTEKWQLIVVDNGSTDGSAEAIAQRFPAIELIVSPTNLGYAGGNNLGLNRATGDAVVLLNSDVIAVPAVLGALADYLRTHQDVGALSPRLLTGAGIPQAFTFGNDPTFGYLLRRGARSLLGRGTLHDWGTDQPVTTDWVSGACLAVNRKVLEGVGGLDERFFLYFEDIDWCLRMRRAGWRVVYNPTLQVIHLGGTSQPQRHMANRLYYQSMLKFYKKHYNPFYVAVLRLALVTYVGLSRLRSDFTQEDLS